MAKPTILVCAAVFAASLLSGGALRAEEGEPEEEGTAAEAPKEAETLKAAPADSGGAEPPAEGEPPAIGDSEAERIEAVVRGFYVEAKAGGGYMLLNQPVEDDAFNVNLTGDEAFGVGGLVSMVVGYDITDLIGVQVLGGMMMADTRRRDKVRDLSLLYVGLGARVAIDITDRLDYTAQAAAMFVSADNVVETSQTGFGLQVSTGVEYYVHLRHFSVGLEVCMILPVQPVRLFLALAPSFKYTF